MRENDKAAVKNLKKIIKCTLITPPQQLTQHPRNRTTHQGGTVRAVEKTNHTHG